MRVCLVPATPGSHTLPRLSTPLARWRHYQPSLGRRGLLTLAIETSCDDTSVAVLETRDHVRAGVKSAKLHFHESVTADNSAHRGIHPVVALESHQRSLGPLVQKAIGHLPAFSPLDTMPKSTSVLWATADGQLRRKPDFVSVTRGPGMRTNLGVGLQTAKGLALAWNVPLVGVHHMQAHALTPRLVSALDRSAPGASPQLGVAPAFPFLSFLVSGGHTLLLSSDDLVEHNIIASTADTSIGDCLDKCARSILPPHLLTTPYGRALEMFAFPDGQRSYGYMAPRSRKQELERRVSCWGWSLGVPLSESRGGRPATRMEFSFCGLESAVQRIVESGEHGEDERRELAREVQRVAFEHLAGRLLLHLSKLDLEHVRSLKTIVVSGGVAANGFLRHVLRSMLDARGFQEIKVVCPPIELCTDNAAMIAWTGCEMFEAGWRSGLEIEPIRKWSLDASADDGGIMGASGWQATEQGG